MTALTEATNRTHQDQTDTLLIPVAGGVTLYVGSLLCSDYQGYAVPAADAPYYRFEGIAVHAADANGVRLDMADNEIDNSDGDDGDVYVLVRRRGRWRIACQDTVDQSVMGRRAYVFDDNTVAANQATVTHQIRCGRFDRIISANEVEISIVCGTHCTEDSDWNDGETTTAAPTTTTTTGA